MTNINVPKMKGMFRSEFMPCNTRFCLRYCEEKWKGSKKNVVINSKTNRLSLKEIERMIKAS